MHPTVCHDFKTPRPDASGRLPAAFIIVPILVYFALLGGSFYNITNFLSYRRALHERDSWKQLQAEKSEAQAKFESLKSALEIAATKAEKLAQWVEGTRTLQPLCVAITRSLPPASSLGDMNFDRSAEMPAQINLSVRINQGTMDEVGRIQSAVQNLNYHPYNSQEIKNNDNLEYKTMLVWHQP
jgi:hypothetical protein